MILTLILDAGHKVESAALGLDLLDPGGAAGGRVPVLVVALIAPYGDSWEQNFFTIRSLLFMTSSTFFAPPPVCIFTQPPLLSSLTLSAFPGLPLPHFHVNFCKDMGYPSKPNTYQHSMDPGDSKNV